MLHASNDARGIHVCMYSEHAEKGVKDVLHVAGVSSGRHRGSSRNASRELTGGIAEPADVLSN